MTLTVQHARARLAASAEAIRALVDGVDDAQARWKPAPDQWSIVEVVNHLADEEREDFRARLERVLRDPDEAWPPIHPSAWVTERGYAGRGLRESLDRFLAARAESLAWLDSLAAGPAPDWNRAHVRGDQRMTAGDLLVSWVAHDLLHVRQLARLHYTHAAARAAPHSPEYAGGW